MKAAEKSWVTNFSTRTTERAHWACVDGEHIGPVWMVVEEGQCKEVSEIHSLLQAGAIAAVRIVSLF